MSENHKITKVGKDHHAHLPMLSIDLKFITRANKSHMFLFYKQKKKKEKKRGKRITSLNWKPNTTEALPKQQTWYKRRRDCHGGWNHFGHTVIWQGTHASSCKVPSDGSCTRPPFRDAELLQWLELLTGEERKGSGSWWTPRPKWPPSWQNYIPHNPPGRGDPRCLWRHRTPRCPLGWKGRRAHARYHRAAAEEGGRQQRRAAAGGGAARPRARLRYQQQPTWRRGGPAPPQVSPLPETRALAGKGRRRGSRPCVAAEGGLHSSVPGAGGDRWRPDPHALPPSPGYRRPCGRGGGRPESGMSRRAPRCAGRGVRTGRPGALWERERRPQRPHRPVYARTGAEVRGFE